MCPARPKKNDLASQVKKGRTVRAIGILHLESDGTPVLRVRNCDEVVYVPPVPVSLGSRRNPRTGDLIWIAVGVMVLSGIGLAVLLKKRKKKKIMPGAVSPRHSYIRCVCTAYTSF